MNYIQSCGSRMCHSRWSQLPSQIFLNLFLGVLLGPCENNHLRTGCTVLRSSSAQTPFSCVLLHCLQSCSQDFMPKYLTLVCVMLKCIVSAALTTGHVWEHDQKRRLTKNIHTAIICIGLHGSLRRNYFAVFGRLPTLTQSSCLSSVLTQ